MSELLELWHRGLTHHLERAGWSTVSLIDVTAYELPSGECNRRLVVDIVRQSRQLILMPKIGVRYPVVSGRVGLLTGADRAGTATVSADLIHLVRSADRSAGASRWLVAGPDQVGPVIEAILQDVDHFGASFFDSLSSIDMLLGNYSKFQLSSPQLLDVAVAFAMRGRRDEAEMLLDSLRSESSIVDENVLRGLDMF